MNTGCRYMYTLQADQACVHISASCVHRWIPLNSKKFERHLVSLRMPRCNKGRNFALQLIRCTYRWVGHTFSEQTKPKKERFSWTKFRIKRAKQYSDEMCFWGHFRKTLISSVPIKKLVASFPLYRWVLANLKMDNLNSRLLWSQTEIALSDLSNTNLLV